MENDLIEYVIPSCDVLAINKKGVSYIYFFFDHSRQMRVNGINCNTNDYKVISLACIETLGGTVTCIDIALCPCFANVSSLVVHRAVTTGQHIPL